jgi:DNA polymerase-3 subunit delta
MIIFLYGKNQYGKEQYIRGVKEKFAKEVDASGLNMTVLDGEKVSSGLLHQEVFASGFLVPKRLIIIKDVLKNKKSDIKEVVLEIIQKDAKNENIIIFSETDKSTSNFFKSLKNTKFSQEFPEPSIQDVVNFIHQEITHRGGTASPEIASYMASLVGNDLQSISNEIDKIIHYTKGREILKTDIQEMITISLQDDIFGLVDAIVSKRKKDALQFLEIQFELGANHIYIHSMLVRQFRILIQMHSLYEQGMTRSDEIASSLSIHPYVAKKSLPHVQKLSKAYLQAVYRYLVQLDKQFKTSYADPQLLLEEFVVKI